MRYLSSKRGAVDWALIAVLTIVLTVVGVKWKPLDMFRSKPDTTQLTKLQAERDAAALKAEQAVKDKDTAVALERSKNDAQGRIIQESNALALAAASSVPKDKATPETDLTLEMVQRTDLQLSVQLGALPKDIRDNLTLSISKALNGQRASFDKELAAKDADFKAITAARDAMATQIPILNQKAVELAIQLKEVASQVESKTNVIKKQADELDAKVRSESSLGNALSSARNWLIGLVVFAVLIGGLALYLKMGLGSVGAGLHPLQKVLSAEDYQKVITSLDSNTDKLHQWLVGLGRKSAAKTEIVATQTKL